MPIYLDEQTRPTLIRIIDKWLETHTTDFVAGRIKKALDSDVRRLEIILDCTHEPGIYAGEKACCKFCSSPYEPGMGESWSLTNETFIKRAAAVKKPEPTRNGEQEQGSLLDLAQS